MASDYIHALRDRVAGWLASGLGAGAVANGGDVKSMPPRSQVAARSGWTFEGEAALCDALRVESFEGAQVGWDGKKVREREREREGEREREKELGPKHNDEVFSGVADLLPYLSSSFSLSLALTFRTS